MDVLTYEEYFAQEINEITREVRPEDGNLYYGRDIWCRLDLADDFSDVDPQSAEAVGQAILHRLVTSHGALKKIGGPADYGLGLTQYLNKSTGQQELAALQAAINHECLEDDRVSTVETAVTFDQERMTVRVRIGLQDSSQEFDLVFSLDGSGTILEAVLNGV